MLEACRAGASPNKRATANAVSAVKASARPSIATLPALGRSAPPRVSRASIAKTARAAPRAPPRTARMTLSARKRLKSRPRPEPRALRIATSRSRAAERASSRLATFAQAMRRTKRTAACRTQSATLSSPTYMSSRGWARAPRPAFVSGYRSSKRRMIAASSACAVARLAPGASLATTG